MTVGEELRKLRLARKMTLQDVAEKTGYSKALISRIENDSLSPSISSLMKITSALQIGMHELFSAVEGRRASVVKKDSRKSRTLPGGGIKAESLCSSPGRNKMEAIIETFESGAAGEREAAVHAGEEWLYVLNGRLEASVGGQVYELNEGDSIYVISALPHKWRNPGKGKTSALIVFTPPSS
jgi:transcriptional regulator with XRE-family HTH domain